MYSFTLDLDKGKLHFSSFMFIAGCNGQPLTSIITVIILYLENVLHLSSFSTNQVKFLS
ncbi:hypothetical protein Hanom_Chr15g01363491 [Helianthus anomalus]